MIKIKPPEKNFVSPEEGRALPVKSSIKPSLEVIEFSLGVVEYIMTWNKGSIDVAPCPDYCI